MLPEHPAIHCIIRSRDGSNVNYQCGGWSPPLQLILKEGKHITDQISAGLFLTRSTQNKKSTLLQGLDMPVYGQHMDIPEIWMQMSDGPPYTWKEGLGKMWEHDAVTRSVGLYPSSEWARPTKPPPYPIWPCKVSVCEGSLRETQICTGPGAS